MTAFAGIDHVDVRVPALTAVDAFYTALLPQLGLAQKRYAYVDPRGEWHDGKPEQHNAIEFYEVVEAPRAPRFFGVIEDAGMRVTRTRIAFAVESADDVHRFARELTALGTRDVELEERSGNVAIFFSDPVGTRLEIVYRWRPS